MKRHIKILILALFLTTCVFTSYNAIAQCPMCAANVKSSMNSTTKHTGLGLNAGIYILLVMPYAIVGIVGAMWYIKSRKSSDTREHA